MPDVTIEPWMYDFVQGVADDCFDDEHYTDEVVSDLTRRLAAACAAREREEGEAKIVMVLPHGVTSLTVEVEPKAALAAGGDE